MCQQMSSMPGTVAVIDDIFRAMGCSSITKEELVHKIMINNFDIVERSMFGPSIIHLVPLKRNRKIVFHDLIV